MKYVLKTIFRPLNNRHYNGKKRSVSLYALNFVPAILICVIAATSDSPIFWTVLLAVIAYGVMDYVLFDALVDKVAWKLFWSHFYADETVPRTPEQDAMKNFEINPTAENYQTLQKHLKDTQ